MRRAISWLYWAPKSRTRTVCAGEDAIGCSTIRSYDTKRSIPGQGCRKTTHPGLGEEAVGFNHTMPLILSAAGEENFRGLAAWRAKRQGLRCSVFGLRICPEHRTPNTD